MRLPQSVTSPTCTIDAPPSAGSRSVYYLPALALISAALLLCSCAPKPAPSPSNVFRVALLTPGPVSDAGWNASAFEGLQLIKSRLGAQTAMVQTTSPADFDDAFRDFASRGFKMVKVVFNPALKDRIPAATMQRVKLAEQGIVSGAVKMPELPAAESP